MDRTGAASTLAAASITAVNGKSLRLNDSVTRENALREGCIPERLAPRNDFFI